jgi:transcriptional regulator with XRE-family HTH domain
MKQLQLRKVAAALDVDQSLLSKYERGDRLPAQDFLKKLAKYFSFDEKELMALWLSEKFLAEVEDSSIAGKALKIAEEQLRYSSRKVRTKSSSV